MTSARGVDEIVQRSSSVRLSPRQREVLRLYWERQLTSKEIAAELGIAKNTIDGYFKEAIETLGARDRRDAARLAFGPPPAALGDDPAGVSNRLDWRQLLPLRTGAHNDLSIAARLVWIIVIAAVVAIGFGALASGFRVVSDLFR